MITRVIRHLVMGLEGVVGRVAGLPLPLACCTPPLVGRQVGVVLKMYFMQKKWR